MKKTYRMLVLAMIVVMFLEGCKKGNNDEKGLVSEENSHTITWVYSFSSRIPAENQKEINRILAEKGIEYQIKFITPLDEEGGPLMGVDYANWIKENGKKQSVDIVSSGTWAMGDYEEELDFIKKMLLPLDSFLETADGKKVKEFYTDNEWKQVSVEGHIYVIPKAAIGIQGDWWLDNGVYVSVNEKYKEYFGGFDGTYASLKSIYQNIGDSNLHIVFRGRPSEQEVYALLGYSVLKGAFPYDINTNSVIDITKTDEFADFYKEIYSDFESGILLNRDWTAEIAQDQILAYVHANKKIPLDGFVDYQVAVDEYESNARGRNGVYADSQKKELALEALSICSSDIDILCLLYPDVDRELITRRVELLSENENSKCKLVGIHLSFDTEQFRLIDEYINTLNDFMASIQQRGESENEDVIIYELNPSLDVDEEWRRFKEKTGYYRNLCETVNQQLQGWTRE